MQQPTIAASALAALAFALNPAHAAEVGISVQVSEPGVYGRIDIGRFPQPAVLSPQPVWIAPQPAVVAAPAPVYMWVPPGHRRHWARHCAQYRACGVPVYFVPDGWYQQHVMPVAYAGRPGPGRAERDEHRRGPDGHDARPGHGHGKGRDRD